MEFNAQTKIGDVVLEMPEAMRLFEKLDLDYCCGGHRTLDEVCGQAKLNTTEVLGMVESLRDAPRGAEDPAAWASAPLTELIAHIVAKHHTFTREELGRVAPLMERVLRVHGERHPELARIAECFQGLHDDLMPHLEKEEQILFPYIRNLEAGDGSAKACFGTVEDPIGIMQAEHEQAGELLRELKTLTQGHTPPEDACGSFRSLYMGLQALEADLHLHIYLESHLLFPRAIALESGTRTACGKP